MNTTFLIALLSGEAFLVSGIALFISIQWQFAILWPVILSGAIFLILIVGTLVMVERSARAETLKMRCEYLEVDSAIGFQGVRKKMGLS